MTRPELPDWMASKDHAYNFFEHALAVLLSDEPADTHVVIPPKVMAALAYHLQARIAGTFDDGFDGVLPADAIRYGESLDPRKFKFSELCMVGVLAEQIHVSEFNGAPEQLCVPKYMLDALFQIVLRPEFAKQASQWFSIQDYKV